MRLRELEPEFLLYSGDPKSYRCRDVSRAEANGLFFLCPKCFVENGGRVGTHAVICWDPSVPQTVSPTPGRWNLIGASFDDLSLVAGSSSVLLMGGCNWHGYVTNGEVTSV
jgi:hypothetical protein